jgi:hypothetical protein
LKKIVKPFSLANLPQADKEIAAERRFPVATPTTIAFECSTKSWLNGRFNTVP